MGFLKKMKAKLEDLNGFLKKIKVKGKHVLINNEYYFLS